MALTHRIVALESLDATLSAESALGNNPISIEPMAYNAGAAREAALFLITFSDAVDVIPEGDLIIHDDFTGLGADVLLDGRAPNLVNLPGNTWSAPAVEGDGSGHIRNTGISIVFASIDTEITDNRVRASIDHLPSGSLTGGGGYTVSIMSDGSVDDNHLFFQLYRTNETFIAETIGGIRTILASQVEMPRQPSTLCNFGISYDGQTIRAEFNQEILLTAEYNIAAGLDGNPRAGITFIFGATVWADEFKVWDL